MKSTIRLLLLCVVASMAGCGQGDAPTVNAPAAKGAGGVPILSDDQMAKLAPDQQERIKKDQEALQRASSANQQRHMTGQMPSGG